MGLANAWKSFRHTPPPLPYEATLDRANPDPATEPIGYTNPNIQPDERPDDCSCRALLDAAGQNPECPLHGWWTRDPAVLDLADLTRELGSALAAAKAKFGGGA